MPIEKEPNTYDSYEIRAGGFKGLFTALDSSLIPDGYLAAMKNVKIDDFGVMHSVTKPKELTFNTSLPNGGVIGMIRPTALYVQVDDDLRDATGAAIWTLTASGIGVRAVKAVSYIGGSFIVDGGGGLVGALGNSPAKITAANGGYTLTNCADICIYKDRLYYAMGSILRYSHPADPTLTETWSGTNVNNFIDVKFSGDITALVPTQNALYIFTTGKIYALTEPKSGSFYEVYSGPDVPDSTQRFRRGYCDGHEYFYATNDGLYQFGGTPELLSNVLTIEATGHYVGYYDHRLWFLCLHATGQNPIYALNLATGAWEQYEGWTGINFTAILGGGDGVFNDRSILYFGAVGTDVASHVYAVDGGQNITTDVWPWEFTTKNFTPSLDSYSTPRYVKITYAGQPNESVATIALYTDGVLKDTVTRDMVGSGLYHVDIPIVGDLGNSFQLKVSGTGTMDIKDIGIEFSPRRKGDANA